MSSMYSEGRQQEIVDNSGWLGGGASTTPTKKWQKPKAAPKHKEGQAWKESEDWIGGGSSSSSLGYSPRRNSKEPIKIEGMRSSIRDNPFLKNDH